MLFVSARILGVYLVVISALQLSLYAYLHSGMAGEPGWLTYQVLDPRTYWSMIEQSIRGTEPADLTIVGLLSAMWILAIGISFVIGRLPFTTYIASELVLGIPQLLLSLPWGLLMVSEGEGIGTSFAPAILVVFFTLVPVPWAAYLAVYGVSESGH